MNNKIKTDDILKKYKSPKLLSDSGGQNIVYTITDSKYGKSCLKIGTYGSKNDLERVVRAVEALRNIQSDYFPKIYDFQIFDENRYLILEEFLSGGTLTEHITNYSTEQDAIAIIKELLSGLRILWKENIVHRDLKPENIIITSSGPKIIDLGIARMLDATSLTETLAMTGPGSPRYAAPEQFENRKTEIDFRADQFTLGIIFAQLVLKGEHPFSANLVGTRESIPGNIVHDIWCRDIVSNLVTPPTFEVISRLLGHEPYERFRKPDDVQLAIDRLKGK